MSPAFPYLCALRLAKWEQITEVVSGVISFDIGHLNHQDQMVNLVIVLKNQVTQMIQQIELLRNQVQLLTNPVGAAQTKKTVPTVAKTNSLPAGVCVAQQNEYDTNTGPKLMIATRSGDAVWVQTLLSAPDVQSYINYTEKNGRTPLYTTASKGHVVIVEILISTDSNVNLAKTTDGTSPILIAAEHGHALVVQQLIVCRCNVDLALTTNGATTIASHNGHTVVVKNNLVLDLSFQNKQLSNLGLLRICSG
jgi:hypothetical protein